MYLIESFWFLLRLKHTSLILTFVVGRISHIMNLTFVFCVIDAANLSQVLLTFYFRAEGRGRESASTQIVWYEVVTYKRWKYELKSSKIQVPNTAWQGQQWKLQGFTLWLKDLVFSAWRKCFGIHCSIKQDLAAASADEIYIWFLRESPLIVISDYMIKNLIKNIT